MVSIIAHPFNVDLAAALGVTDLAGVTKITLVVEPFKISRVYIERDLMRPGAVAAALESFKVFDSTEC